MLRQLEHVPTLPTIRLGLRLILLTMVRKSELIDAVWSEVNFENAVWSIPKERMKQVSRTTSTCHDSHWISW